MPAEENGSALVTTAIEKGEHFPKVIERLTVTGVRRHPGKVAVSPHHP
jgi:hypothetical protein